MDKEQPDWEHITDQHTDAVVDPDERAAKFIRDTSPIEHSQITANVLKRRKIEREKNTNRAMLETYMFRGHASGEYEFCVVLDYTLHRHGVTGQAQKRQWCITVGIDNDAQDSISLIYARIKAFVKRQIEQEHRQIWMVWTGSGDYSGTTKIDQLMQLMKKDVDDHLVILSGNTDVEPAYAHYRFHLGPGVNINRRRIVRVRP